MSSFMARALSTGVTVLLGSALGMSASLVVLNDRIRSQEELVADVAPPPAALVTVAAEQRELRNEAVFRVTVDPATESSLRLPASVPAVVTRVNLKHGGVLEAGSVPIEVEGRPVIAVPGRFRFYRELRQGDNGPDVVQLQRALDAAGLPVTGEAGRFGPRTRTALNRLYSKAGYDPPGDVLNTGELWVLPRLPRSIERVVATTGMVVGAEDKVLATFRRQTRLRGSVPPGSSVPVRPGSPVRVLSDEVTDPLAGKVISVGEDGSVESGDTDAPGTPVVVQLDDSRARLSSDSSYQVTITGAGTAAPVLAVPVTAVNQMADGSQFVAVAEHGRVRNVGVRIGIRADGWVAVRPAASGRLRPGSKVVVGLEAKAGPPVAAGSGDGHG
jgi:hypothetical protein